MPRADAGGPAALRPAARDVRIEPDVEGLLHSDTRTIEALADGTHVTFTIPREPSDPDPLAGDLRRARITWAVAARPGRLSIASRRLEVVPDLYGPGSGPRGR